MSSLAMPLASLALILKLGDPKLTISPSSLAGSLHIGHTLIWNRMPFDLVFSRASTPRLKEGVNIKIDTTKQVHFNQEGDQYFALLLLAKGRDHSWKEGSVPNSSFFFAVIFGEAGMKCSWSPKVAAAPRPSHCNNMPESIPRTVERGGDISQCHLGEKI
jgi:hypothetical protein